MIAEISGEIMLYDPNVLKTVPDCCRALDRATEAGKQDFVKPLMARLAQLGGEGYSDPLEASFHSTLAVYEQTLKKGRANYVRRKLKKHGGGATAVERILIDWSLAKGLSSGFEHLVENGLKDQVGEYIVGVKFPDRFSPNVVQAARDKLIAYDILTSDELNRLTTTLQAK